MGRSLDDAGDTEIALALAQELGVLRLVQPCISLYSGTWSLNLTLKDTTDGGRIASETFTAETPQELLNRLETPGFAQTFALELPGFTPFDLSFFLFLALELLLAGLLILRPRPLFNQILIILGGTLFLFAWFFARNANMDYVQRFVAHGGSLKVASSTARQQLEVAFRFLPLLVTNIILYLFPGGPLQGRAIHSNSSDLRPSGISVSIPAALGRVLLSSPALIAGAVSGVLYALAFPSLLRLKGIPLLGFVALVPLFTALRRTSPE